MADKLDKRRKKILHLLEKVPISSTQQLAEETGVSTETMRKDLDALAEEGLITKVHGGVALSTASAAEIPFDLRTAQHAEEKKAIAKLGVQLILPDDILVLESCTTNLELAKKLVLAPELPESLIVITNSFSIASVFDGGRKCKKLFFLGGWVNPLQFSCRSSHTVSLLKDFHVSKAFLSGAALSGNYVLSGYYDEDVAFQKAALSAAQETILMMDHSKFNKTAILSVAPLSKFDCLITDRDLPKEFLKYLNKHALRYLKAQVGNG